MEKNLKGLREEKIKEKMNSEINIGLLVEMSSGDVRFLDFLAFFFIVFIGSSPDIRWKCYKNTANSRTKKENIEIYENRILSVKSRH